MNGKTLPVSSLYTQVEEQGLVFFIRILFSVHVHGLFYPSQKQCVDESSFQSVYRIF